MTIEITAACCPAQKVVASGGSIPITVTLTNQGDRQVVLLASGVPWLFHHAVRFRVVKGPARHALENRIWVIDPPELPDTVIGPGETAAGEVDLATYLFEADGACISELPGRYRIGARIVALAGIVGEETYHRLELKCEPFTLTIKP